MTSSSSSTIGETPVHRPALLMVGSTPAAAGDLSTHYSPSAAADDASSAIPPPDDHHHQHYHHHDSLHAVVAASPSSSSSSSSSSLFPPAAAPTLQPKGRCWCCWELADELADPLIRACTGCKDPDLQFVHQSCVDSYVNSLPPPADDAANPDADPHDDDDAEFAEGVRPADEERGRLHPQLAVRPRGGGFAGRPRSWRSRLLQRWLWQPLTVPVDDRFDLPPDLLDGLDIAALRRSYVPPPPSSLPTRPSPSSTRTPENKEKEPAYHPPNAHPPPAGAGEAATHPNRSFGLVSPWTLAAALTTFLRVLLPNSRLRRSFRRPSSIPSGTPAAVVHPTLKCTRCTDPYTVKYLPVPMSHTIKKTPEARKALLATVALMLIVTLLCAAARVGIHATEAAWSRSPANDVEAEGSWRNYNGEEGHKRPHWHHGRHGGRHHPRADGEDWWSREVQEEETAEQADKSRGEEPPAVPSAESARPPLPHRFRPGHGSSWTHYRHPPPSPSLYRPPHPAPPPKLSLMVVVEAPGGLTIQAPLSSIVTFLWAVAMLLLTVRCVEICRWLARFRVKTVVGVGA